MTLLTYCSQPATKALRGEFAVPGDKSISHRAIMLAAIAEGESHLQGFLAGEDCLATVAAFQQLGVSIDRLQPTEYVVHGVGREGLSTPVVPLDLGNSGTSMRLLTGLLSGAGVAVSLIGDDSLQSRPMQRVIEPLLAMGARIRATAAGTAPLHLQAHPVLQGIDYLLPVASAQVKSAILLAGIFAEGDTVVHEPVVTRDHTERMLRAFGYPLTLDQTQIKLQGGHELTAVDLTIPGDISSAAFFIVAASIVPKSRILIKDVGVNPTRIGVINILRLMGADIKLLNRRYFGAEPVADLLVSHAPLTGIEIPASDVSLAIDEFPAIFIAAACAEGTTVLSGAAELRVKESDRLQVMADGLQRLQIAAKTTADGIVIDGGDIQAGAVSSAGDHRVAMAFAVAGLRASGPVTIDNCQNVATSFPGFLALAQDVGFTLQGEHHEMDENS